MYAIALFDMKEERKKERCQRDVKTKSMKIKEKV